MRSLLFAALLLTACKKTDSSEERPTGGTTVVKKALVEKEPVKKGSLEREVRTAYGIIPRSCSADQAEAKVRAAAGTLPNVAIKRLSTASFGWVVGKRDIIGMHFAEGDADLIDKVEEGIVLDGQKDATLVAKLAAISLDIAKQCNGWVISVGTGNAYDVEQGTKALPTLPLDARRLIALHAVSGENELNFIDTMGLRQVGLPEISLRNIPTNSINEAATLVNVAAQALVQARDVTRDGELDIDARKLTGDWHLDVIEKQGGSAKITWKVRWNTVDEDGKKREEPTLELIGPGADETSAVGLMTAISTYFGSVEDHAQRLDGMQEDLAKAGEKAREALRKQLPHFAKGIPQSEALAVKAPFDTDQGNIEWMWVDVFKINATDIEGTLANSPDEIKSLKLGAHVKVKLDKIADFTHKQADGKTVGGYSLDVLRAHGMDVPPLN